MKLTWICKVDLLNELHMCEPLSLPSVNMVTFDRMKMLKPMDHSPITCSRSDGYRLPKGQWCLSLKLILLVILVFVIT